jgi:Na+-translocating ferredoxin:NAD+ oxidoreductase RnfD subunit
MTFGSLLVLWLVHAVVVMASVAAVSSKNPENTLPRALVVTLLGAVLVTPFSWFWWLVIPGLVALTFWTLIYALAYGIGPGKALAAGIVQAALHFILDRWVLHGRLG